jgi:hypothetical protein
MGIKCNTQPSIPLKLCGSTTRIKAETTVTTLLIDLFCSRYSKVMSSTVAKMKWTINICLVITMINISVSFFPKVVHTWSNNLHNRSCCRIGCRRKVNPHIRLALGARKASTCLGRHASLWLFSTKIYLQYFKSPTTNFLCLIF